jgi:hypothetical protein
MGPVPYSARGRYPRQEVPNASALVDWEVDTVDAFWTALGRPDPFTLVEIGAGDGSRAAEFLGQGPECLAALRYVLVEDDPSSRERQSGNVPVESPIFVLGPVGAVDEDGEGDQDERASRIAGLGPMITSLAEPPVVAGPAVVLAIGWASRLPSDRLEWRDGRWWEVRLAATDQLRPVGRGGGGEPRSVAAPPQDAVGMPGLRELLVPLDRERSAAADAFVGCAPRPDGARYSQLGPAAAWLTETLQIAESGWLAVIDRWTPLTAPLATGEVPPVALDQLASVRRPVQPMLVGLFSEWSVITWRLG